MGPLSSRERLGWVAPKGGCQSFCLSVQRTIGGDACAFGGFRGENSLLTVAVYWKQVCKARSPNALAGLQWNSDGNGNFFTAAGDIKGCNAVSCYLYSSCLRTYSLGWKPIL